MASYFTPCWTRLSHWASRFVVSGYSAMFKTLFSDFWDLRYSYRRKIIQNVISLVIITVITIIITNYTDKGYCNDWHILRSNTGRIHIISNIRISGNKTAYENDKRMEPGHICLLLLDSRSNNSHIINNDQMIKKSSIHAFFINF